MDGEQWTTNTRSGLDVSPLGRVMICGKPTSGSRKNVYRRRRVARKRTTYYVDELVLETYGPDKPAWSNAIEHLDGENGNSHIDNLRWSIRKILHFKNNASCVRAMGKAWAARIQVCGKAFQKTFPTEHEARAAVARAKRAAIPMETHAMIHECVENALKNDE